MWLLLPMIVFGDGGGPMHMELEDSYLSFATENAAGALLASENDKPAAAPRTGTALLRRFRSFVCDMTLPSVLTNLNPTARASHNDLQLLFARLSDIPSSASDPVRRQ